jgi:hypothetical protein
MVALSDLSMRVPVSRHCPHGGMLSPLLWCLINDLISRLNGSDVYTQDYADDVCLLAMGKFPNAVSVFI